jgi:hypothetical protein
MDLKYLFKQNKEPQQQIPEQILERGVSSTLCLITHFF